MKVNIVFDNNGYGLKKDAIIIANILRMHGCKIYFNLIHERDLNNRKLTERIPSRIKRKILETKFLQRAVRWDMNIFLENPRPYLIDRADRNLFIPNQDWLTDTRASYINSMDGIFCKSKAALSLFRELGTQPVFTGFTSLDMYRPEISHNNQSGFLHLAGKSENKGTSRLLDLWNDEAPDRLFVVYRHPVQVKTDKIILYNEYLPDQKISELYNSMKYHLCLSECEGFGQYINEALSCGATIVTIDASPMNEIVEDHYGFLIKPEKVIKKKYYNRYLFDKASLLDTVKMIRDNETQYSRGFLRNQYLRKKKEFEERFLFSFNELI